MFATQSSHRYAKWIFSFNFIYYLMYHVKLECRLFGSISQNIFPRIVFINLNQFCRNTQRMRNIFIMIFQVLINVSTKNVSIPKLELLFINFFVFFHFLFQVSDPTLLIFNNTPKLTVSNKAKLESRWTSVNLPHWIFSSFSLETYKNTEKNTIENSIKINVKHYYRALRDSMCCIFIY